MEELVERPEAPAAGALAAEEGREETGRVEAGRGGIEEEENGCGGQRKAEDADPPATHASTV